MFRFFWRKNRKPVVKNTELTEKLEQGFDLAVRGISYKVNPYLLVSPPVEKKKELWNKLVKAAKRRNIRAIVIDSLPVSNSNEHLVSDNLISGGKYQREKNTIIITRQLERVISFLHEFIHHVDMDVIGVPRNIPHKQLEIVAYVSTFILSRVYFGFPWYAAELMSLRDVFGVSSRGRK